MKEKPFGVEDAIIASLGPLAVFVGCIEAQIVEFISGEAPRSHLHSTVGLVAYHVGSFGFAFVWRILALLFGVGALVSVSLRVLRRSYTQRQLGWFVYSIVMAGCSWAIWSRAMQTDLGIGQQTPRDVRQDQRFGWVLLASSAVTIPIWCVRLSGRLNRFKQGTIPRIPPSPPRD